MTAPVDAGPRLAAVAAWDVPLLRFALATLDAVADRLRAWRARVDGVGRSLASGECWSGPAARGAAGAAEELSAAAWAVDSALADSLSAFRRLAAEAGEAQELAARALATVGTNGLLLDELAPGSPPAFAVTGAALSSAAAAAVAADDAGSALARLGVRDAFAPADLADLADRGSTVASDAPRIPTGRSALEVAAWWASLSPTAQLAAIRRAPDRLGGLGGVPAWARDRANRDLLERALEGPRTATATVRGVARQIRAEEAAGHDVQLLDLDGDRVALALGDLDTADSVALLVPGVGSTAADDLGRLTGDARDVVRSARAADPALAVAAVVWLGYRAPGVGPAALGRGAARAGGPVLAAGLAGLEAARAAAGQPPARTTVVAHSYGTVVVDEAADAPGTLDADAVVLLGSPGMDGLARSLEIGEVYDAGSVADPISQAGWFGHSTWAGAYGSTGLPVDSGTGHSEYLAPGSSTLAAVGEVVAGRRHPD